MNVKELIEVLKDYPDTMKVFVASDEAWNSVVSLGSIGTTLAYDAREYSIEPINEEDAELGKYFDFEQDREMTVEDFDKVLVIW